MDLSFSFVLFRKDCCDKLSFARGWIVTEDPYEATRNDVNWNKVLSVAMICNNFAQSKHRYLRWAFSLEKIHWFEISLLSNSWEIRVTCFKWAVKFTTRLSCLIITELRSCATELRNYTCAKAVIFFSIENKLESREQIQPPSFDSLHIVDFIYFSWFDSLCTGIFMIAQTNVFLAEVLWEIKSLSENDRVRNSRASYEMLIQCFLFIKGGRIESTWDNILGTS